MIPAVRALERLREGNLRFAEGRAGRWLERYGDRIRDVAEAQEPFAAVLGCSDSRVPAEIVFDQGLGDLFVVRVAGNVAAPSQVGSVEFAVERFDVRLVVVLGHSGCGAVRAVLDGEVPRAGEDSMRAILDRIRPCVEHVSASLSGEPREVVEEASILENVRAAQRALRTGSQGIARAMRARGLQVVGALYRLDTGLVEWLDGSVEP
ncbi:MAG: carbonic anhydrase [Acidobacteriota bacterium]